ncbi:MAG: hypothetical protein NTV86_12080 [Planctomycetota bacterium]|nr:hypothetical protein [Planctomycetota bacterium]
MKTMGIMVGALLLMAAGANAALTGSSLKLQIDTVTGQAYLVSTVAETIPLCGYYVKNATGKAALIPDTGTFDLSHWVRLSTYAANGHSADLEAAGLASPDGWGALMNSTSYLGEAKLVGVSNLAGYARVPIGHITSSTVQSDFSTTAAFKWQWQNTSTLAVYTLTNNSIEFIPEPATLCALLAAMPVLSGPKRRTKV